MKNLYDTHPFMIDSGTFWRCDHGTTGYNGEGCIPCADAKIEEAEIALERAKLTRREAKWRPKEKKKE